MITGPPLPAIGSIGIEIYGPAVGTARWDAVNWDDTGLPWNQNDWQDVTPQSMTAEISWGADYAEGVLTSPAAGQWAINTYDPQRILDPSNSSSPYVSVLRPGNPVRIVYREGANTHTVRVGLIDEISYNISTNIGRLRGTDLLQLLARARLPAGQVGVPTTLRAAAAELIKRVSLTTKITVDTAGTDPPVGAIEADEAPVLDHIAIFARDAQYAFWLDRDGIMRFRSFGDPIDNGVQLGGLGGIAMESLSTDASLAGIYTSASVYDTTAPTVKITKTDGAAQAIFGDIALLRERPVPGASAWATNLLNDRAGASLQYTPGILRIQTKEQLLSILQLEMVEIVTIAVDSAVPPINIPARCLGVKLTADTVAGWAAEILSYIPAKEWTAGDIPVPPEPEPPPATQTVVRTYTATKDSRAARTSGGSNYGSGTEPELPVGAWSGWRNRAFIDFSAIPWGDVKELVKAELTLRTSTQVNVGFGSSPKIVVKRVTSSWSEGSLSSPGSGNSLVYPGPSVTSTGSVTKSISRSENVDQTIDITAIVRAWAPAAIGGSAQTQRGVGLFSSGEDSTTYTTEFKSRETANDPVLKLTVKIPA